MANDLDATAQCHDIVTKVLNRETDLAALSALDSAIDIGSTAENGSDEYGRTVIAFDTNVVLRLSSHQKSADIIDFLRTSFQGKLVLPGQVIQEFWNNQLSAIETVASSIRKHSENLKKEVEKIDSDYGEFAQRFQQLIEEFHQRYGYTYDEGFARKLKLVVNLLSEKAIVPYCRRSDLSSTAVIRKRTRTPPGFKDDLDGDFFIWADLLLGVATLADGGFTPIHVALVTNDSKTDWSRNGVPHPILSAEMKALCGATFKIWSLEKLAEIASR